MPLPIPTGRLAGPVLLAAFFSACLLHLAACSGSAPEPVEADPDLYSTRGIIRQLPDASRPGSELFIHHEAIPEFVDIHGEPKGMGSMTMPFPVTSAEQLDGLAVGDRVGFEFEVRWQGSPPMRITRIEPLPAETRLEFERVEADGAHADDGAHSDGAHADDEGTDQPASESDDSASHQR